jgi:protein-S-isoprenylcysteine O-methyltransferase Ste14
LVKFHPKGLCHTMNALELKVPPPLVAALVALAMWATAHALPAPAAPAVTRWSMALVLAAVAATFDLSALITFHRAKTTINPMAPAATSTFVRSGIYRITRNPMYVGLVCWLCAWAAYLWSPWALLGPPAFAGYVGRFQITPEERILEEKFGDAYRAYKTQVRRWI